MKGPLQVYIVSIEGPSDVHRSISVAANDIGEACEVAQQYFPHLRMIHGVERSDEPVYLNKRTT